MSTATRTQIRRANQARTQRNYRLKLQNQGLKQLNIMVPTELYDQIKEFLKQDKEILESALQRGEKLKTEKKLKAGEELIETSLDELAVEKTECKKEGLEESSGKDPLFYMGDFSRKFKALTKGYETVAGKQILVTTEEKVRITAALEPLSVLIEETKDLSQGKAADILYERGYYTFNKNEIKCKLSSRLIATMRKSLSNKLFSTRNITSTA